MKQNPPFQLERPRRTGSQVIEDVERGAELSFSGPLRGPLTSASRTMHHRQILVGLTKLFWFQTGQTDGRTDGRTDGQTDGQTDAISMFWAFLVLKN